MDSIFFRPTKNSILECRSVIEEKMWFWEGMSSLANNLKILLLALPNRSGDSCLVPVSINHIPRIATTSGKWSNSGEFSLVAVRELLYFCVIEIGFAQGAICLIAVSL